MNAEARTWGPVVLVLALLPAGFLALRACLPPIGNPGGSPSPSHARSSSCIECHPGVGEAWAASTHARAEWGFEGTEPWPEGWEQAIAPHATATGAIGVEPLFQLLVPTNGGRLQATSQAWDPSEHEWFGVFDDPREPGDWGHWTGGAMTWNSQCASCHATEVSKGYDAAADRYDTDLLEHGVGCVACHGREHGASLSADQSEAVCLSCHSLRAELTGAFRPGDAYLDHFAPTWVDHSDGFFPDGQIRTESFEATAYLGSKMHAAGLACTACHDPHSGALVRPEGQLCEGCHEAMPGFAAHDPHPDGTVGCVGCHMQVTTYMERDPRHDHGFAVLDPRAPAELGPDPCTRCHTDQDRAWAASVADRWWPTPTDRTELARAVAIARAQDPAAVGPLLEAAQSSRPVGERATAVLLLALWADQPQVHAALVGALASPDGRIRFAAATALASSGTPDPELEPALQDPLRAVRVAAARAFRGSLPPNDPRLADYRAYLTFNADQPTALHEGATWHFERGDPRGAVALLERAIAADPGSSALHDSIAVALAAVGAGDRAATHLERAVRLSPSDATLWMRLGLARAGVGDVEGAIEALRQSTRLAPDHARTWYNLGLAEVSAGNASAGIGSLERAVAIAPADLELRYGLAATHAEHGDPDEAQRHARAILEAEPTHAGAQRLRRP